MISKHVRGPVGSTAGRRGSDLGRRGPDQSRTRSAVADFSPEPLERRVFMDVSLTAETLVNASKLRANQIDTTIAVDPTNTNRVFAASSIWSGRDPDLGINDPVPNQFALVGATSTDGGATWSTRQFASGPVFGGDNLPPAIESPRAEFDQFGNLWVAYRGIPNLPQPPILITPSPRIYVLLSTDGGQTFQQVADFNVGQQPSVSTGGGSVWVSWVNNAGVQAAGAVVTGLGAHSAPPGTTPDPTGRGQFTVPQSLPGSVDGGFGDVAVGPAGEVMVAYQTPVLADLPGDIVTHIDRDGVGPGGFEQASLAAHTNVGGFDPIPATGRASVNAAAGVEFDRSNGPHRGRAYLVYTNESAFESALGNTGDLDVYVRYSDDLGGHWSDAFLVNDDVALSAPQPRAQFLPAMAVDQTTGKVAVGFYDARNDTAADRNANDDVQYFVAVGTPTATNSLDFAPNLRLGLGQSDAKVADSLFDFGRYTGVSFSNNFVHAAWPDNSNVTRDNPAGARRSFDMYTGRVRVTDVPFVPPAQVTPGSPLSPTPINEMALVRKGKFYNLKVSYTAAPGAIIDPATLGDTDLTVTGPNGFSQNMLFRGFSRKMRGQAVVARYRLNAPGGTWDASDNGVYTVTLNQDAVRASNNVATPAGVLTKFLVDAAPGRAGQSAALRAAPVFAAARLGSDDDGTTDGATALLSE